jgi:4-hydroxybenzoyl-CoA thioesterase
VFELTFPVRFDDVDAAGLVYYPRLLDYCHVGLEDFFTAVGPCSYAHLITVRRRGFPTVHLEADFKQPLRYGDTVRLVVRVLALGKTSVRFGYSLHRGTEPTAAATAVVVTAYMDLAAGAAVALDEDVRTALARHLEP